MASSTPSTTILTAETVPAYLKSNLSNLVNVFPEGAELTAIPVLGGNVNYGERERDYTDEISLFYHAL